jgi:hypothetical protein
VVSTVTACTCTGCPPARFRILFHLWQEEAWEQRRVFEPCPPEDIGVCRCPDEATQEDLLCDHCRGDWGISWADTARLAAFLDANPDRYAVPQKVPAAALPAGEAAHAS